MLEDGGTQVSDFDETPDEISEILKRADRERTQQMWSLYTDIDNTAASSLTVGIGGERGALSYWDGHQVFRPATGSNPEPVDYWWADHHTPFAEYTEVAAEDVLAAAHEFLQTSQRPTCIEWMVR